MSEKSKMQKINCCVDCNDYVECDIANAKEIPTNCPLPDYDWKEKLVEWIDSEIDIFPDYNEDGELEGYYENINIVDLKQKIKEL